MALDFPSNPVDGQVFGSYIWSSSKGVWQAREESATVAITSPVKPLTANNGDFWYNTSTGITYIYYDDGTSGQWVEVVTSGLPSAEQIMPTGSIIQTARSTAPNLWLLCQGQAISRSTYQTLYNAIGTSYGSGDGSTTFNVPNLQGVVPVGKTSSGTFATLGGTGGVESVTLTSAQSGTPAHSHTGTTSSAGSHSHSYNLQYYLGNMSNTGTNGQAIMGSERSGLYGGWNAVPQQNVDSAGAHTHTFTTDNNTAANASQAHTNLQPYIVLNYMIKV